MSMDREALIAFLGDVALGEALQANNDADLERIGAEFRQAALDVWASAPAQAEEGRAR
jgi:hypothetical protein